MTELITLIAPYIPAACWPLILVVGLYLIIKRQRQDTKQVRDKDYEDMKTRVAIMENEVNRIKDLDLDARLSSIETSLSYIKLLLEHKNEKE